MSVKILRSVIQIFCCGSFPFTEVRSLWVQSTGSVLIDLTGSSHKVSTPRCVLLSRSHLSQTKKEKTMVYVFMKLKVFQRHMFRGVND